MRVHLQNAFAHTNNTHARTHSEMLNTQSVCVCVLRLGSQTKSHWIVYWVFGIFALGYVYTYVFIHIPVPFVFSLGSFFSLPGLSIHFSIELMKHISQNLLLFDIKLFNIINERRTESCWTFKPTQTYRSSWIESNRIEWNEMKLSWTEECMNRYIHVSIVLPNPKAEKKREKKLQK